MINRKPFIFILITAVLFPAFIAINIQARETFDDHSLTVAILDLTGRNHQRDIEAFTLKHTFEILGIPYFVTSDLKLAQRFPVIYTAGSLQNTTLSGQELELLYSYVEAGGTLVSALVLGNKYFPLFGIEQPVASRKRFEVFFPDPQADSALKYIDRPEEKHIFLGNNRIYSDSIWSNSFKVTEALPLAVTEDGLTIIAVNNYGKGAAYVSGLSYSETILTPQVGGDYEAQRGWSNIFEPGADVFMLFLKAIFEESLNPFVYLSTIPDGQRSALLLTHDVDAQSSFESAVAFARLEKEYGVRGTYFITTKYVKDETDIDYYDTQRSAFIKKVKELGMDVGSHSVIHSNAFTEFPLGDPAVTHQTYQPLTKPTIYGELKVSKELLDRDLPGQNTISFRAGELKFPEKLIAALDAAGYQYDATFSACDIMTNFAFRPLLEKNIGSAQSKLVEIPLTFDDSQGMLRPDNVDAMVAKWLDIISANADNEAISVLLIHPTVAGYKLEAEAKLLAALKGGEVWVNDLTSYGRFWNQRSQLRYDLLYQNDKLTIKLHQNSLPAGITFVVKETPRLKTIELTGADGRIINTTVRKRKQRLFLHQAL